MRLMRDGVPVDAPELRRARVRQLLSALAIRPVLTRDQAIELLWPGLDPAKAARNMRVTLTHLRRLLEPDRSGGDASYHLRRTMPAQTGPFFLLDIDSFWTPIGSIPEYDRNAVLTTFQDLYEPARTVFQEMLTSRLKDDLLSR